MAPDLKKINTILFDLDGTLIDSSESVADAFNCALERKGYAKAPPEKIAASIGNPLPVMFAPFVPESHDPDEMVELYRERYEIIYLEKTRLIPHVADALEKLAAGGFTLGVATTKPRYFTEPILENLGVLKYISTVAGAEEVENLKPAPDVLLLAMERLGKTPAETLFVGDTPLDVGAARAAGIPAFCVETGHGSQEELKAARPDELFENLLDFAERIISSR